MNTKAPLYG